MNTYKNLIGLACSLGVFFSSAYAQNNNDIKKLELSAKAPYRINKENEAQAQKLYQDLQAWLQSAPDTMGQSPSAKHFPGLVKEGTPRISKTIKLAHQQRTAAMKAIDDKLRYSVNFNLLYNTPAEIAGNMTHYSTGLYAPAGEVITFKLPAHLVGKAQVQIGIHTDKITPQKQEWRRMPLLTITKRVDQQEMKLANPFGGLIYINAAPDTPDLQGEITIEGAVASPHYVDGVTSPQEFAQSLKNTGAPWGEFETGNLIVTMSVSGLKKIADAKKTAHLWKQIVGACYDLAQIPEPFFRKQRLVLDEQISVGLMHSGYPLMAHHREGVKGWESEQLFYDFSKLDEAWGFFHEIGHNMQNMKDWVFNGTAEVSVNLFSLYIYDQILMGTNKSHSGVSAQFTRQSIEKYFSNGAQFKDWQADPFLGLILFRQIRNEFGWDIFKKIFARFNESSISGKALTLPSQSTGDQRKIDNWVYHLSDIAQRDFAPFFRVWGIPVSDSIVQATTQWKAWMPYNFPPPASEGQSK